MAIRSIITMYTGEAKENAALEYSLRFAESHGAHLDCLHVSQAPEQVFAGYVDAPVSTVGMFVDEMEKANHLKRLAAEKAFTGLAGKLTIPVIAAPKAGQRVSASFIAHTGNADRILCELGKTCDIIILPRNIDRAGSDYADASNHALFDTGVPVLFVPPQYAPTQARTICVAWNGSREAAHALHCAMPLLEKANDVHIVSIQKPHSEGVPVMEAPIRYLALHGIKAHSSVIHKNSESTAKTLLAKAEDVKADMLVMGAYSHSRLTQFIMGGVTSYMVEYAPIPVLMTH